MDEHMQAGMAEATRLTQAGQLAEATALIQRMLKGLPVDDGSEARRDRVKDAIETELWVVPDTPPAEGKEADFKEIQTEEKHSEQEYSSRTTGGHKGPRAASPPLPPLRDPVTGGHKGPGFASPPLPLPQRGSPPLRERPNIS